MPRGPFLRRAVLLAFINDGEAEIVYNHDEGDVAMYKRLSAVLMAFLMMLSLTAGLTPSFAAGTTRAQARAQANAYNKHSLGLTSVVNARDLGGYKTKDGRTVKFGKLLRTGDLADLSEKDKKILLKKYHLKKDIDFRSFRNLVMDGQDPELPGVEYCHYPYSSAKNLLLSGEGVKLGAEIIQDIAQRDFDGKLVRAYFRDGYVETFLSEDGLAMIRGLFNELLDANGKTVLFHCHTGKDRTGNAAMLLLTVLGVDKETIIADYMLTNDYLAADQQETYDLVYKLTRNKSVAKDFSYKDGVSREWIEASYATIDEHYGSMDNFLKNTIGLSNKDMKKLQKAYLQ